MNTPHVPAADGLHVWLLQGCPVPWPALAQAMARRHPEVHWACVAEPPQDAQAMPQGLRDGRLQLVLLVGEQTPPCAAETRWRDWLQQGRWPHAVLHLSPDGPSSPHNWGDWAACGPPDGHVLNRLAACVGLPHVELAPKRPAWRHWGGCEGCSDPDCEQRLFQALLASRSVQA